MAKEVQITTSVLSWLILLSPFEVCPESNFSFVCKIVIEASRLYIESLDKTLKFQSNQFIAAEGLAEMDLANTDWMPYFEKVPTTRTVRAGKNF